MDVAAALGHALWMAFAMLWEILWPLILGFGLSAVVLWRRNRRSCNRER